MKNNCYIPWKDKHIHNPGNFKALKIQLIELKKRLVCNFSYKTLNWWPEL